MVSWLHCSRSKMRQTITVEGHGRGKLLSSQQLEIREGREGDKNREKGTGMRYSSQGHTSSVPIPPTSPDLPTVPITS